MKSFSLKPGAGRHHAVIQGASARLVGLALAGIVGAAVCAARPAGTPSRVGAEPDPGAAAPWHEPISEGGFTLQCSRILASTRWSLTSGNASQHCGVRVDLQVSRTGASPDTSWFALKRLRLIEARDERGFDLRGAEHRDPDERRIGFAQDRGPSFGTLWLDALVALPESISVLRGEAEVVTAGEIETIDVPFVASRTWQEVAGAPGLKVMLPRVDFADGHTSAEILTRVDTTGGNTDAAQAGPPYVLSVMVVLPSGHEIGVAGRAYGETLVGGGVLNSYSATAPQAFPGPADPERLKLRFRLITTHIPHTIPFALYHLPVAADGVGPLPPASPEPSPYIADDVAGVRVQPVVERHGLVLRQMWLEALSTSDAVPGGAKTSRSVKITAYVDDLLKDRFYGAVPKLTLTEVRDQDGRDLLAAAGQIEDPYSGPRGYVRPPYDPSRFNSGQLLWELKDPARLPRLLGVMKGRIRVLAGGVERPVDIPIGPAAKIEPLPGYPSIRASAHFARQAGDRMDVEVEYTRPMPPPAEPAPGTTWRRSPDPAEAGPPFVSRIELLAPNGRSLAARQPQESLGRATPNGPIGTVVGSTVRIEAKNDQEAKIRLWIVDELVPLDIDFEHKDVPVASLRRRN